MLFRYSRKKKRPHPETSWTLFRITKTGRQASTVQKCTQKHITSAS
uniref:Uncharacterized protein n=1 Tax=Anguilla anguilla TaxID=7936 RepID=A0A0E9QJW7_ANGAN